MPSTGRRMISRVAVCRPNRQRRKMHLSPRVRSAFVCRIAALLSVLLSAGCGGASRVETPGASEISVSSPSDTVIFKAVIAHLPHENPDDVEVRVDPRPLEADPRVAGPGEGYRADSAEAQLAREIILERRGIETTDAARDTDCDEGDGRKAESCPEVSYYSVAISLPMPGNPCWPGLEALTDPSVDVDCREERRTGLEHGRWWVRVSQGAVSEGTATNHELFDLVLERDEDGEWTVVDSRSVYSSLGLGPETGRGSGRWGYGRP